MSHFTTLLAHSCKVGRATETDSPFGGPAVTRQSTGPYNCRFEEKSERAYSDRQSRFVTLTRLVILFSAGTDVREDDVITDVTVDGVTDPRSFRVNHVLMRVGKDGVVHHLAAEVEAI